MILWFMIIKCILGTSPDEGSGLCHAICEYLLSVKVSKVMPSFLVAHEVLLSSDILR